jgi:hypothetical protein
VRIGVVQRQPGGGEGGELRADLGGELPADVRAEEVVDAQAKLVGRKLSAGIHEVGKLGCRQHGGALDHHQMQPHAQVRQGSRPAHGVGRRRGADHQAGAGQSALAMGELHRFVDRLGQAEIVGREDDPLHGGPGAVVVQRCCTISWRRCACAGGVGR